jgi:hypothetical protein
LLNDKSLATKRREQGIERAVKFRWQETARQTLDAYRAAVEAAKA